MSAQYSITLKSLKYRHLTLYLNSPPHHHHAHTHTQRSRSLPQTPTHEHINTPLSCKVQIPTQVSITLSLRHAHISSLTLQVSCYLSYPSTRTMQSVYFPYTQNVAPKRLSPQSCGSRALTSHTTPTANKHTLSPFAPLSSFYLSHMRTRPSSFPVYIYAVTLSIAP